MNAFHGVTLPERARGVARRRILHDGQGECGEGTVFQNTCVLSLMFTEALFEDLVRSYQEDFDMELAEATEEAKRELNMRGLAYVGDSHKSQKLPDPPCLSLLEEMVEYSKKRNVQRMLVLSESLLVFDKIEFIPQSALPSPVCLGLLTSATLLGEEPTGLGASSAILKILLGQSANTLISRILTSSERSLHA